MDLPTVALTAEIWIAACAHRLQQRWRTIDPSDLEAVADQLWRDTHLRAMSPTEAATEWLKPVACEACAHAISAPPIVR